MTGLKGCVHRPGRIFRGPPGTRGWASGLLGESRPATISAWLTGYSAVAQKIGAVETADDFLKARAGTSKRGDLTRLLDRAPDVPPTPEDAIER